MNISISIALLAVAMTTLICGFSYGENIMKSNSCEVFDLQGFINSAIKEGNNEVTVPPGIYRIKPERRQHLLLANLSDVTIIADGVEMICTETTRAVTIHNCQNVTIRGLTIDYDPLPYTQGRIIKMSEDKMAHEIELFDGYPTSEKVQVFKYEIFRSDTRTLRFGSYHNFDVEKLDSKHIRVTKGENYRSNPFKPEEVGDIIAIGISDAPGGSIPHAVYSSECTNLRLEEITLYASNCFGFLESNCNNTTYLRCKIDRRPSETDLKERQGDRIRSLNADAFHSKHAAKGPSIINCTAKFQGDDCVNICGDYHMIMSCKGKELRVLAKHSMNIEVGNSVELLTYKGKRLPNAKVVLIAPDGEINSKEKEFLLKQRMNDNLKTNHGGALSKAYKIILDRVVELPMGSAICSMQRTGNGFAVEDCDFGYNRSRGILIKASDGKVSGNRLAENWGEAIKVAPEYWWLESGSSNNVEVSNNIIDNCRSIAIAVYALGGPSNIAPAGAHNNMTISGNKITNCQLPNILVTSTLDAKIENNICKLPETTELASRNLGTYRFDAKDVKAVMTLECEDYKIKNNKIE